MQIHEILAVWFLNMKRDLPWRNTCDPYKIWLSEIILQQTRVQQGISFYNKIISVFPDIFSLARAKTDTVLKLWQGLGYYTRARNMHETAKYIASRLNGNFPDSYNDLIRLKGIGPYTAAAIASIAFNQPVAAIDGNVSRVLSRFFLIAGDLKSGPCKAQIRELADSLLDKNNPGLHNQAIMEFGAMICLPGKPKCMECPLKFQCLAFKDNRMNEVPAKYHKKKLQKRFFNYYIIVSDDKKILLHKRKDNDIWIGLYEPPLIETSASSDHTDLLKIFNENFKIKTCDFIITKISAEISHILSHQQINARFVHVKMNTDKIDTGKRDQWIDLADFPDYPVPRLIDRYFSGTSI